MIQRRPSDRSHLEIRPMSIELGVNRYAEGSALIRSGNTHVLCTASIEETVPGWLQNKGKGWITAEYSMLPRATHTRSKRDREKVSGRTQEIQRLVGRALRSSLNLSLLGERSIMIDCDVLQADGGTRTASITGGCVALALAVQNLAKNKKISPQALSQLWTGSVAAISVGIKENHVLVDLDYEEDSSCDVDMNFVISGKNQFIEVQGTGEQGSFSKEQLDAMTSAALDASRRIREVQLQSLEKASLSFQF